MRHVWDLNPDYRRRMGPLGRCLFAPVAHYLRLADVVSAARVDEFIANSEFVRDRIRKFYRREAQVVHPPVDTEFFSSVAPSPGKYYLCAGELVGYKRVDLAVQACMELRAPLVVAGDGPERARLERQADSSVTFTGRVDDEALRALMASAKALIFPGVEDFGMVPVEAMACGKPVLAFARGGSVETVRPGLSGILFAEQSVAGVKSAIVRMEREMEGFDAERIRSHAHAFGKAAFQRNMRDCLARHGRAI